MYQMLYWRAEMLILLHLLYLNNQIVIKVKGMI